MAHHLFHRHITVKMELDGVEYQALRYFPLEFLDYVDQLVVEWKFSDYPLAYWGNLDVIRRVHEKLVPVAYQ